MGQSLAGDGDLHTADGGIVAGVLDGHAVGDQGGHQGIVIEEEGDAAPSGHQLRRIRHELAGAIFMQAY